ncbi:hypothetical protein K491DRAFT_723435 [Lophiostoma macrostomum CBS 122681]|uniref:Uncharacterized protein n=1 Tax=Lophiostoma macrostomum CBS 122681 TaxID=1314788 RepID=A0A6A6SI14_9PLEO|nr:hypothetical protein K491DRAFT_723435 [Lophiostoma macrostomum CBS 122681]
MIPWVAEGYPMMGKAQREQEEREERKEREAMAKKKKNGKEKEVQEEKIRKKEKETISAYVREVLSRDVAREVYDAYDDLKDTRPTPIWLAEGQKVPRKRGFGWQLSTGCPLPTMDISLVATESQVETSGVVKYEDVWRFEFEKPGLGIRTHTRTDDKDAEWFCHTVFGPTRF